MKLVKKSFRKILVFVNILIASTTLFSQTTIEISITKQENYPNHSQGGQFFSYAPLSNGNLNFNSGNPRLNAVFNHFKVRKFKPAFPAAFLPIAQNKVKPEVLARLKSVYQIECIGNNENGLKDSLIKLSFDTSMGIKNPVLVKTKYIGHIPNDFNLQYSAGIGNPYFNDPNGWHWYLDKIKAPDAWEISKSNANILIGITGENVSPNHPDIINKINFISSGNFSSDHGTAIAQLAAGQTNNNEGLSSIGYNAKLNIYNSNSGNAYNNILIAALSNVRIINCSWVVFDYTSTGQDAINTAYDLGSVVICGAGNGYSSDDFNSGKPLDQWDFKPEYSPEAKLYPASYENAFSVTSTYGGDEHANQALIAPPGLPVPIESITHNHNTDVDLCAPGYHIWHAWYQLGNYTNTYAFGDGTSFSAPLVSGTVALMLDANPNLTSHEIMTILKQSSDPIYNQANNSYYNGKLGAGRLNAFNAVKMAQNWGTSDFIVNTGETITWLSKLYFYKKIIIKNGGQLTIDNSEIYMADQGKIVVEAGGRLFVKNSTIKSHPVTEYLPAFSTFYRWQGIEVEGQRHLDQSPINNQGYLNIVNSTVKDAKDAISTISIDANGQVVYQKGGGVIIASNVIFKNNLRHVQIMSYHRPKVNSIEKTI